MRLFRTSSSVPTLAVVMKPFSIGASKRSRLARSNMKVKYSTLSVDHDALRCTS